MRSSLLYFFIASLWIFFSDNLLLWMSGSGKQWAEWQLLKGIAFVLVTSVLLYVVMHLHIRRVEGEQRARRRHETSLRQAAAVFDSTQEGVLVTDARSLITHVNPAFSRITGYREDEVTGRNPNLLKSGRHPDSFYQHLWNDLQQRDHWSGEVWNRRKNGELYPIWQSIRGIRNEDGDISHYVAVFSDITAIKRSQREVAFLAHYDPLTQLPNRLLFNERVQQAIERHSPERRGVAVLHIDLDHFKHVNESMGHNVGDQMLRHVAERLSARIDNNMTLARLGGDEFALLSEDCPHLEQAAALALRLQDALTRPIEIGGSELFATASIGISLYPQDADSVEQLLRNADSALFKAKSSGRERYAFYSQELTEHANRHVELAAALRNAVRQDQLRVYYQPIHDLASGAIDGFESLVRWQHPQLGLVPPNDFIPVAEETGMIAAIDTWMLRQACRQMVRWLAEGRALNFIAVNISSRLFGRDEFHTWVAEVLAETGLAPHYLELEITESAIMENADEALGLLQRLDALGVRLSIDDFGTGYSSLQRLKHLPVRKLKIDQGFTAGLPHDSKDIAITRSIITLARSLDLNVLAEGIENQAQARFLLGENCLYGQGYWYDRPKPPDQLDWQSRPIA